MLVGLVAFRLIVGGSGFGVINSVVVVYYVWILWF